MAGLLGEYETTFSRVNPAQGLMQGLSQGFNTGSKFALALRQQKLAEQEQARQAKEQELQNDLRQLQVLGDMYGKMKSKTGKQQLGSAYFKVLGKINPELQGMNFTYDESADKFMSKARGLKNLLVENPGAGLKEIDNLLQEVAEEADKRNLERQEKEDIIKGVGAVKSEAAGQIGGEIISYNPYTNPQSAGSEAAAQGVKDFQQGRIGEMFNLDPESGQKLLSSQMRRGQEEGIMERAKLVGTTLKGYDAQGNPIYDIPREKRQETGRGVGEMPRPALDQAPATIQDKVVGTMDLGAMINDIEANFDPKYIGPVVGRGYKVGERWVNSPKEQSTLYAQLANVEDTLLRLRSGAQIGEYEYARLEKFLPKPDLPLNTFNARFNQFKRYLAQVLKNRKTLLTSNNYMTPEGIEDLISSLNTKFEGKTKVKPAPSGGGKFKIISVE